MNASDGPRQRLAFLLDTVEREAEHLRLTDARFFAEPFTTDRAARLGSDVAQAEQLDAFSARFARLQDTAGDRLLPALLARVGEPVGSVLDNLDRAARLGLLVETSETWLAARALRNRMVHEYIRDPATLAQAVREAHGLVPMLLAFAGRCRDYVSARHLV